MDTTSIRPALTMIFPPTRRRWKPFLALPLLAVAGLAAAAPATAADTARRGATETALDRYVAKADATFAWKKLTTNVTVTPNTLPFPPYDAPKPKGFLTN